MVRRIAGTICFASALMMILWLATGATASGFVKFSLLGIIGSILVLYKWDDLDAVMPRNRAVVAPDEGQQDLLLGTEIPPEAFGEPVLETKPANFTRPTEIFTPRDPGLSSVLVAKRTDLAEEVEQDQNVKVHGPAGETTTPETIQVSARSSATTELVTSNRTPAEIVTSEPTFIQLADYSNDELVRSVRAGEESLVTVLTESGMLSTEGPVTDTDVATMVFVAVSSDDLLRALLEGKEAEELASGLSYSVDRPELYEPAPQLVEPRR